MYRGTIDVPMRKLVLWHAGTTPISICASSFNNKESYPRAAALYKTVLISPYSEGTHIASVSRLSNEEVLMASQETLYTLLLFFADVFRDDDDDLGHTQVTKHDIDTGSATPIRQPLRQIPKHKQEEAQRIIQRMLVKNIIFPTQSPLSSPVILVKKKDGSLCFCVEYRKVNSVTRTDAYPLPRINDFLDTLAGLSWFTTLDVLSGYWQLEVAEDDQKTAFSIQNGLFQFNVMPVGLCNARASFQCLMDMVLAGLLWDICLVYIDDVIIMGRDFNSHFTNIANVLHCPQDAGLMVIPSKCNCL
uniref:Reverse transcriptase domain-containing protein n=1 Tax=Amphimedon queenslandica TaxID=400682 RepID=A0A1X7V645_AMPQE